MSTCKDCIHENVCSALIKDGLPWEDGKYPAEAFCMAFRNKADVVEVRHGYWQYNRGQAPDEKAYFCCLCAYGESDYGKDKYCPNCGAKMDGERKENGT